MMKRFGILAAAIALASASLAAPALAGSSTKGLIITATTQSTCTAISPSTITFANAYDPFTYPTGTPLKETGSFGSFSTNCTSGDAITWQLDAGGHCNSGSVSNDRALVDGTSHYLSYELYPDNTFTGTQWATTASCGASALFSQTGGGKNTANSIKVYALIPGGQDAYVGNTNTDTYSDSVNVTLNY